MPRVRPRRDPHRDKHKMKAALYCRVSTEEQTVVNQEMRLREWARTKGYDFEVYSDVISGASKVRPGLDRLMDDVRKWQLNCVVVWKLDRLGRSLQHLISLIEEFKYYKVQFVSLTENIDTESANGRLTMHIFGALAEFEREMIVQRTHAGLDRAKAEGKTLGRPKGSKDKKPRDKRWYWLRWAGKKTRRKYK